MGMPVLVEVCDPQVTKAHMSKVYEIFTQIDEQFSTYKSTSEISQINLGKLPLSAASSAMQQVLRACEATKQETDGYFDISHNGQLDPSGYVKGWAIAQAAEYLSTQGFKNFYVNIAGDIQTAGYNEEGKPWRVGIQNPFNPAEIIKVVHLSGNAIATSGNYLRGNHIYNPHQPAQAPTELVSLTVIAQGIIDADRFATAAFAMGSAGLSFLATHPSLEAYGIDSTGTATFTPGFMSYTND
jgi:thiamine biosynthesis lipoprotein